MSLEILPLLARAFENPDKRQNKPGQDGMFIDPNGQQTLHQFQTPGFFQRAFNDEAWRYIHANEARDAASADQALTDKVLMESWLRKNKTAVDNYAQHVTGNTSDLQPDTYRTIASNNNYIGFDPNASIKQQLAARDVLGGYSVHAQQLGDEQNQYLRRTLGAESSAGIPESSAAAKSAQNKFTAGIGTAAQAAMASKTVDDINAYGGLQRQATINELQRELDNNPLMSAAQRMALESQIRDIQQGESNRGLANQLHRAQLLKGIVESSRTDSGAAPFNQISLGNGSIDLTPTIGTLPTDANYQAKARQQFMGGGDVAVDKSTGKPIGHVPQISSIPLNAPIRGTNPTNMVAPVGTGQQDPGYYDVNGFDGYKYNPVDNSAILREGIGTTPITDTELIGRLGNEFKKQHAPTDQVSNNSKPTSSEKGDKYRKLLAEFRANNVNPSVKSLILENTPFVRDAEPETPAMRRYKQNLAAGYNVENPTLNQHTIIDMIPELYNKYVNMYSNE